MSSTMRGAYKAKLREASTTVSRRKSRGVERKKYRDDEVNKRRHLSPDMSPVVEKHEDLSNHQQTKPRSLRSQQSQRQRGTGPNREKPDVLERLKHWREEKKRRLDQEKLNTKAKPMFKVGSLNRTCEAELYARGQTILTSSKENKVASQQAVPKQENIKKDTVIKKENGKNISADIGKKIILSKNDKKPSKSEVKVPLKNQEPKVKEPLTVGSSRLQRVKKPTADLASKLTVAAAAKRNDLNASPKKFLRATRTTTLQKKDSLDSKKGSVLTKLSSKSTGNLLNQKKRGDVDVAGTAFKPQEVPKILENFNFAALSGQHLDVSVKETFVGATVKSNRKSLRKSSRLAALNTDPEEENVNQSLMPTKASNDHKSKRKSLRKSSRLANVEINHEENNAIHSLPETESSDDQKSKRKSAHKSIRLSSEINDVDKTTVVSMPQNEITDGVIIFTPGLSRRKSVRKSKRLSSSITFQQKLSLESDFSGFANNSNSVTPKLTKRKSTRKSKASSSSATKKFEGLQISNFDAAQNEEFTGLTLRSPTKDAHGSNSFDAPKHNLNKSALFKGAKDILVEPPMLLDLNSKRKSVRKSLALDTAQSVLQSDSKSLNSGSELSTEEDMEIGPVQDSMSDLDTQVPLIDFTSTPKSTQGSRKSLGIDSMTASSIEEMSSTPEKIPKRTPKSNPRCSRSDGRSSVLRRRSQKSSIKQARMPKNQSFDNSSDEKELSIHGSATPNSVRNMENIPENASSRSSSRTRKSTVISVSDEGTAVGRDLELALAYTVEKPPMSAKASRILKELVIEKVEGERSFFEVSFDESMRESQNTPGSCKENPSSSSQKIDSVSTSPFTPRKSDELTCFSNGLSSLATPKSVPHTRHSMISSAFKEPGLPLSALRSASRRRRTECSTPSKTPEQMINILKTSPMVEMSRRRSRHVSSPAPPKGQYFRDLIHTETERLSCLCNKWNDIIIRELNLDEEVLGQIRSTVGKALLLMEQRFKQFSGLVDNYVYDLGEKKTTPTDLQGFWDMIYFQVEDVDAQFKELEELKQSNWQKKVASPKIQAGLKLQKKTKGKVKAKGAKSNFAAFKAELQKKKAAQNSAATHQDNVDMISIF